MKPLEDRFASMLKPRATATDITNVLAEIDGEIGRLDAAADQAHATSLDTSIADDAAERARSDEQGYRFASERWTARRAELEQRLKAKIDSDVSQAKRDEFDAAENEAAALADEIRDRVPVLFGELVDLFGRIQASDFRVQAANRNKPGGAAPIVSAEQAARGYGGVGVWPNLNPVERLTDMAIPRLDGSGRIWPVPVRPGVHPLSNRAVKAPDERKEAAKRRYTVQRTDRRQGTISLIHADGVFKLGFQEHSCWFYPHQIEACRAAGMTVAPVEEPAHG